MKRIINGKRYDTETAIKIGEAGYGYRSDFQWWSAGLYKTPKSGAYFMAGEGNGMSPFATRTSDGLTYGERLTPMSESEAMAWAEEYLSEDEIEKHFGHLIEDA